MSCTEPATSEHAREFMVVGKDDGLSDSCPALSVQFFPGKKSLAEAVIAKAKANRQNNSREKYSFKGNGWNNGVGVSAQYNKQHTFYLEADYTQGNLFDQKQVNGGYRFSF